MTLATKEAPTTGRPTVPDGTRTAPTTAPRQEHWRPQLTPWRVAVSGVLMVGTYAGVFLLIDHVLGS